MAWYDRILSVIGGSGPVVSNSTAADIPIGADFASVINKQASNGNPFAQLIQRNLSGADYSYDSQLDLGKIKLSSEASSGTIGINDYGFKGKRQYIADRRYLVDLFVIAYNTVDIRAAIQHLRNEIFRRGIEWVRAFDFKCVQCDREYTVREVKLLIGADGVPRCTSCGPWKQKNGEHYLDEQGNVIPHAIREDGKTVLPRPPANPPLRKPDDQQKKLFEKFLRKANYFGQSFENVLRECEDDINVVDDAALFISKTYYADKENPESKVESEIDHIFRLDPVLIEFDLDYRGIPGMRHHVCVFHREHLYDVPPDANWEDEWGGTCLDCHRKTYPVWFKYNEQYLAGGYGSAQTKVLYLLEDEVIHWSRYTPTETYGYPPILSIYEQALTLIGMNRYLYDYFYERKVPQGIVTTTTDDVDGLEQRKADIQMKMQQDPHYIPWIAVNSKTGQGRTEFVRFAYSLDELNYLPVRDEIRERVSALYGVSNMWLNATEGAGGLNNESQQLVVMSRVVEGAQRSYKVDIFDKLLNVFSITDWKLEVKTPEEINEEKEVQLKIMRMQWAQGMVGMGFGIRYNQDDDTYQVFGEVKDMETQQKEQMAMSMGMTGDQNGGASGDPTAQSSNGGAPSSDSGGDQQQQQH